VFSDSGFEQRLYTAAGRVLKKYDAYRKKTDDEGIIKNEDTLAALIFYAAKHKRIAGSVACAHLFGCDADELKAYMSCLGVKGDGAK
jgi:hypothetical protein